MSPPNLTGLSGLTEVGRGAYGVTYRAWHDRQRRHVAVKVLDTPADASAKRDFVRDCRALRRLSAHPNIIAVQRVGRTDADRLYVVMPFHERGSLAERTWRRGPLSWKKMLDVGVRLAGGLHTAHDAGVLHRDIKPGNVLTDTGGAPQLTDFGQAGRIGPALTGGGTVVASPAYAAPEILRGAVPGTATDVYSLTATLVALVNGRAPHSRHIGENVVSVMSRVLTDAPVDLRKEGVPADVCEVLEWGLEKDPRNRPPSAEVLGKALQGAQRRLRLPRTALPVTDRDRDRTQRIR
ncbi:MAG TPA: serine/threonine-protein kinase [Actinophytocola sp.]|jgi:non-specific serine/threonine protein kinase/serine/threonine-protein kinase PknK|nr:serine/threonine-protein kinase [Actinophytocola sp.]